MDRHGVAHSAVAKDLFTPLTPLAPVLHHVVRQNRAELLDRQRIIAADAFERRQQHARIGRNADPAFLGDRDGAPADERWIRQPLRRDEHPRQRIHFFFVQEVPTLAFKLALHLRRDRLVDDDRVFRRAEDAVVERLAGDDVVDRLPNVRRPLHERRRVARTDAVRGFPCAVCRPNEAHAAGRENHGDIAMLHQFLRTFQRHFGHPVDCACRSTRAARSILHHLGDPTDALDGSGMRAHHDRAAGLDGDQDFVNRGRGGVRRRHDSSHNAERLSDFDDPPIVESRDDSNRLHRTDEVVHLLRAEQVLLDLVFDDTVTGFLDRQPRERFRL